MGLDALVQGLLKTGAPWGLLCAVLLGGVVALWRRSVTLSDKLYELGMGQVKRDAEVHQVLENVQRELQEIRRLK